MKKFFSFLLVASVITLVSCEKDDHDDHDDHDHEEGSAAVINKLDVNSTYLFTA
jgi:hypothetical protein